MTDPDTEALEGITQLFIKLGAPEKQARVMAAQLLKRAAQIAREREISVLEATAMLLKQVVQARQGDASCTDTELDD